MDNKPENWDKEWAGLEPRQRRIPAWGCWIFAVVLAVILIAACTAGLYFLWQRLDLPGQPGEILIAPTTVAGNEGTPEIEEPAADDLPLLAPTVTLPSGNSSATVEVLPLSFVPALEGDLFEWEDLPFYTSEYLVYNASTWDGSDDVTALWRFSWDNINLYFAVEVEDDRHVQTQTGNQIFRGDSISLQFDTQLENDFGPQLSRDDFQIDISPGDFNTLPPSAFRFRGTNNGSMSDAPGHNITIATRQAGEGYTLEVAIPWQDLEFSPESGKIIGVALNVNDNDMPGTAQQEVMKSHVAARLFADPTSWGTLTLR